MTFLEPDRLWLLVAVALLIVLYVAAQRRRRRYAVRFAALPLLERVAPRGPGWRRHAPAVAFLLMAMALVTGFARPEAEVRVPREEATIVVALDVSTSMRAQDVSPNRFEVAREAARAFVDLLPEQFNIGIVAFAQTVKVAVPPTTDRVLIDQALDDLTLAGGTAIGDAITSSVKSIRPVTEGDASRRGKKLPPARVVLLSDGGNSAGSPIEAGIATAVGAAIPVSTIAYGTPEGVVPLQGRILRVPVDEEALAQIATETGGVAYKAASKDELKEVYADLGSSIGYRTERREVTSWFIGFGLLAALLAAAGSLAWFSRLP
ncbi:MAG: Ca-activated chloride channel [Actinomycetota bacterium]|nr:Ca-activated chloride channel [Actinomycetota bacterium]